LQSYSLNLYSLKILGPYFKYKCHIGEENKEAGQELPIATDDPTLASASEIEIETTVAMTIHEIGATEENDSRYVHGIVRHVASDVILAA
jgi:hypothetical protein